MLQEFVWFNTKFIIYFFSVFFFIQAIYIFGWLEKESRLLQISNLDALCEYSHLISLEFKSGCISKVYLFNTRANLCEAEGGAQFWIILPTYDTRFTTYMYNLRGKSSS